MRDGDICRAEFCAELVSLNIGFRGADYSRLGFSGQPTLLRYSGAASFKEARASAQGPSTSAQHAVVAMDEHALSTVSLDNATLSIVRAADLLNVKLRFRNMQLHIPVIGETRIVPKLTGAELEAALLEETAHRPFLIAELPPQHVMEEAFPHFASATYPNAPVAYPNVQLDPWPPVGDDGVPLRTWSEIDQFKLKRDPAYYGLFAQKFQDAYHQAYVPPDPPIAVLPARTPSDWSQVYTTLWLVFGSQMPGSAPPNGRVRSRLSGGSRLSFTFPYRRANATEDLAKAEEGIRFAAADLLDWRLLEPAVSLRASSYAAFEAKHQPPPTPTPGPTPTPTPAPPPPTPETLTDLFRHYQIVTGAEWSPRLHSVADLSAPADYLTAIEYPSRLILSPDQTARFASTPLGDSVDDGEVVPMWTARLDVDETGGRLRAVFSPDYRASVFTSTDTKPPYPDRGIAAPWDPSKTFRNSLSAADRHELVALTSLIGLPTLPRALGGQPPTMPRLADGNVVPPTDYVLRDLREQAMFLPDGMTAHELTLGGLGGSVSLLGEFEPPAGPLRTDAKGPLFPALNIKSLKYRAVIGYDFAVEVVYKGFLFPLGALATLVKSTTRTFETLPSGERVSYLLQRFFLRIPNKERATPFPGQPFDGRDLPFGRARVRMSTSPEIYDPYSPPRPPATNGAISLTGAGYGVAFWPIQADPGPGQNQPLRFQVELDGAGRLITLPLIFIDNTAAHDPKTVKALVDHYNGLAAAGPNAYLRLAEAASARLKYAPETKSGDCTHETQRWIVGVRGRATPGTPPDAPFTFYEMDSVLEGQDQPPFYPYLEEAQVNVRTVGRFTGMPNNLLRVGYNELYRRNGFDAEPSNGANKSSIYLDVYGELDPANPLNPNPTPAKLAIAGQGQRTGFAQPQVTIVNLSRTQGVIGGRAPAPPPPLASHALGGPRPTSSPQPDRGAFDPASFFHTDAKLLGIVPLQTVVRAALIAAAPKLVEEFDQVQRELDTETHDALVEFFGAVAAGANAITAVVKPILGQVETATPAGFSIADLYPELDAALTAVSAQAMKLGSVAQAGQEAPSFAQAELVLKQIGATNSAVVDLADELMRLANDPCPHVITELLQLLRALPKTFGAFAVAALSNIAEGFKSQVTAVLTADAYRAYRCILLGADAYFTPAEAMTASTVLQQPQLSAPAPADLLHDPETSLTSAGRALAYDLLVKPALDARREVAAALGPDAGLLVMKAISSALDAALANVEPALLGVLALAAAAEADARKFLSDLLLQGSASLARFDNILKRLAILEQQLEALRLEEQHLNQLAQSAPASVAAVERRMAAAYKSYRLGLAAALQRSRGAFDLANQARTQLQAALGSPWTAGAPLQAVQALSQFMESRRALLDAARSVVARTRDLVIGERAAILQALGNPSQPPAELAALDASATAAVGSLLSLVSDITSLSAANQTTLGFGANIDPRAKAITDDIAAELGSLAARASTLQSTLAAWVAAPPATLDAAVQAADRISSDVVAFAREQEDRLVGRLAAALSFPVANVTAEAEPLAKAGLDLLTAIAAAIEVTAGAGYTALDAITLPSGWQDTLKYFAPEFADLATTLQDAKMACKAIIDHPTLGEHIATVKAGHPHSAFDAILTLQNDHSLTTLRSETTQIFDAASRLKDVFTRLARLSPAQIIDFKLLARQVEQAAIDAIAPNLATTYTLSTKLNDIAPFFSVNRSGTGGVHPDRSCSDDLCINFAASINIHGQASYKVSGLLQPFELNLFDAVYLYFDVARFQGGDGQSFDMHVSVADFKFGPVLQFLEALQSFLSLAGGGDGIKYSIGLVTAPIGVKADLEIDLGTITLAEIAFINVNFGASALLPFENKPAQFNVHLASRSEPFLICAMPFGGGGFFSLTADPHGLIAMEASFEYVAIVAFHYGPLSATGYVGTGIYLSKSGDSAIIKGFFVASGAARIACFGVSACLLVYVESDSGSGLSGGATFTFTFSLCFCDISFSIGVSHQISQSWGSGSKSQQDQLAVMHADLHSNLFAELRAAPILRALDGHMPVFDAPQLTNTARSMSADWDQYRRYFDETL
jgi:hypothetical protein